MAAGGWKVRVLPALTGVAKIVGVIATAAADPQLVARMPGKVGVAAMIVASVYQAFAKPAAEKAQAPQPTS